MKTVLVYGFTTVAMLLLVVILAECTPDAPPPKLITQPKETAKTLCELEFNRVQVACIQASETIEDAQEVCFLKTDH